MISLLIICSAVLLIVIGTLKLKIDPFLMLLIAAIFSGLCFGISPSDLVVLITTGFGQTLSSIGIVIVLGAVIGVFLEKSNGIRYIVTAILSVFGNKNAGLALNVTGFITAIPVFCDAAFVILSAIPKALSKKTGSHVIFYGVSLATGLYAAHVFIPPTPGPLAAAAILKVPLSDLLKYGFLVAIPVSFVGFISASFFKSNKAVLQDNISGVEVESLMETNDKVLKIKWAYFLPILVPILLIGVASFFSIEQSSVSILKSVFLFLGNPIIATLLGVFISYLLSWSTPKEQKNGWVSEALKQAGVIILITGAGGSFGAVLKSIDLSAIINFNSANPYLGILLSFLFAALIKSAQGSSTVAILTTASFVLPLLNSFGIGDSTGRLFTVLAIGSGAMTLSHVNDSYFWVVIKSLGLNVRQGITSFSLATFFQGITGIATVLVLYALLQ
jgi:gluconate:H+ symporter, GntP family